ncbi:hypothetical protein HAX54_008884 [Datura stramonium]|uniref:Uncharacterized protein n=1 Tax=Datura stramonium TaxID=4076 RepID=A0ABS8TFF6_DATST|nr:hypothetical protein [Datura stramonium]
MSDSPSSVVGTPSTPNISIGSTTGSSVSSWLVISVTWEKSSQKHSRNDKDATGYLWKDVQSNPTHKFNWHELMSSQLSRPENSCDIFKKLHKRKNGSFVDTKSKCINDKMEAIIAVTVSKSSDGSQELQEHDINHLYFDVVVTDHAAEERIKLLEEEVLHMRENQERILQARVEAEVQQRLE